MKIKVGFNRLALVLGIFGGLVGVWLSFVVGFAASPDRFNILIIVFAPPIFLQSLGEL